MSPAPDITTREALMHALTEAAELEHGVLCQYLYAAFSLKKDPAEGQVTWPQLEHVREWQAAILLVARQEMEHLGLVCNLLTAVGGTPHFRQPNFPQPARYCPALDTFELQPFSKAVVERFLYIEKAHGLTAVDNQATIGDFYAKIRKGFEHVAATNEMLFIGPRAAQVSNATIDLRPGLFDINLLEVVDLKTTLQAIDQIVEAGDGPSPQRAESHYKRFETIRDALDQLKQQDPTFEPARPVAANPVVWEHHAGPAMTVVRHPVTRRAVTLFNTAYETMLLMLTRFYTPTDETAQEREGLKKIVFFPMMTMVLRPLGEMLTRMPMCDDLSGPTAGPSFEGRREMPLQPHKRSAWTVLHERLRAMAEDAGRLAHDLGQLEAPWARTIYPRLFFLHENLETMALNFERYMDLKQAHLNYLLKRLL